MPGPPRPLRPPSGSRGSEVTIQGLKSEGVGLQEPPLASPRPKGGEQEEEDDRFLAVTAPAPLGQLLPPEPAPASLLVHAHLVALYEQCQHSTSRYGGVPRPPSPVERGEGKGEPLKGTLVAGVFSRDLYQLVSKRPRQ